MEKEDSPARGPEEEAFERVRENIDQYRRIPVSTYRVQFNHRFTFSDAKAIVPYLHELGISDLYASPYFMAKKGSLHGYDVLDHNRLNPEIGTEQEYEGLTEELKRHGMGQVLDIVPNHMNIADDKNNWWMDVLENGPSSSYADFFDIDWKPVKLELENKILLPVLGDQYGQVLESQELKLVCEEGAFLVQYCDRRFPLAPVTYKNILAFRLDELGRKMGTKHPHYEELLSIITALDHLPAQTERGLEKVLEKRREKEIIKRRLCNLLNESQEVQTFLNENIRLYGGEKGAPRSYDLLDDLLRNQVHRLAHWRVATEEINYRRFFDINDLAAIRMENSCVFEVTHQLIFKLVREGKVTGLRVDHPDGLYNPAEYFHRLQKGAFVQYCLRAFPADDPTDRAEQIGDLYEKAISEAPASAIRMPFYIVGEKILTKSERIPDDWPICSTTGYDFLNSVNGLFVKMENVRAFDDIYKKFVRSQVSYSDLVYEKKKLLMQVSMSSEINMLGSFLNRISEKDRHSRDFTLNSLVTAIVEVIANFPVYRTYVTVSGVTERDQRYIEHAVSRAKRRNPALTGLVFDFLQKVLRLQYPEHFVESEKSEWLDFVMRFQQITGPVMAKGVEDTAFYIFNRFISLNEVGGNPERFGTSLETFHGQNIERRKSWPRAMITTSTHDSKRGEDVRARLNVLSEIPEAWREAVFRWSRFNKRKKSVREGQPVPDRNDEYLLYQTLVGAWPIEPMDDSGLNGFKKRMSDYMLKAAREAKVNTSWISPDPFYEEKLLEFIDAVLLHPENPFLTDLRKFEEMISYCGMINSLSQTLLKVTAPGVPDFYQGTEIWDLTLVDPDNRNPVNYPLRNSLLQDLKKKTALHAARPESFLRDLLDNWKDGAIKLYVILTALNYRREHHRLFLDGDYLPATGRGPREMHFCAFARYGDGKAVLVVVPRFLTGLMGDAGERPFGRGTWEDTALILPEEIKGKGFRNIFTRERVRIAEQDGKRELSLGDIFHQFPVALFESGEL